jgi:tRNA (guanine-N7-)-methyltransferase
MRKFQAEQVPYPRGVAPFDLSSVPAGMPLDIEVGCGVGLHPIRYAQEHPERYLVAIEHTRMKFEKFAGRLAHHAPFPNLLAVHADAVEWITHFIPASSVDRYFFLYPNPWPRARDEGRRWYAMPFMEKIIETMKPGATLALATNESYYAEGAAVFLTRDWGLRLLERKELRENDLKPRTHFERKYLARGQVCFNLVFQNAE